MISRIAFRVAALQPTVVPSDSYEITGTEVPEFYHAGSGLVEKVLKEKFFDGWYGWGFYAAFDPEYVRRWYGPIVTRLRATPDAKVLVASVVVDAAPSGLVEAVLENEKVLLEGDEEKLQEFDKLMRDNPIQWVHAVDRLAIEYYDIVLYSDEQIVVKNPDAVIPEGDVPG
jgi:hypothetical protein